MVKLIRTNSENRDFMELVSLLDAELAIRDGEAHSFYSQFNKIDNIKYVVMAYDNGKPAGCGSIKEFSQDAAGNQTNVCFAGKPEQRELLLKF